MADDSSSHPVVVTVRVPRAVVEVRAPAVVVAVVEPEGAEAA